MIGHVTAVIVSKGLDALLEVCLEHLREALDSLDHERPDSAQDDIDPVTEDGLGHAIVVVDNASDVPYGASRFRVPNIRWIRFDAHHSFAHACNAGFAAAPNEFVLLLNNDVLLRPDTISHMLHALELDPQAGICGTRLLFPDGTIQHAGVRFGAGRCGPYHVDRRRPADQVARGVVEFQAVTGACLLTRAEVYRELEGLDESYAFGLEDIDFCLRARLRGWRVLCSNDGDALHFESMTPGRVELDVESRRLFMERWQGRYTVDG
jgi:GT2 family glycosyltransferase